MTKPDLYILIFSFNRGEFLRNCVHSITVCIPDAHIIIWDDNSTDPMTQDVLAELGTSAAIHQPALGENGDRSKHGGLYQNLQSALEALPDDALICAIQDDMQIVRPVSALEIAQWQHLFREGRHRGFMQPAFLKARSADIHYVAEKHGYRIDRQHRSAGAWYSDVFMINTRLLREHHWRFQTREARNEQQAREYFEQMIYLKNPFVAWLPGAPAWRGKRRTLAMRWAEQSRQCGFYPMQMLSPVQTTAFCARVPEQLPLAEDFLTLKHDTLAKPWFYYPLQDKRGLKLLNKLELLLRR